MSALSDKDIFLLLRENKLKVSPLLVEQIQPASIDLRLGETGRLIRSGSVDLRNFNENAIQWEVVDLKEGFTLEPLAYMQACTLEKIEIPTNINAKIFGKNGLLSIGLNVIPAFINPGFNGRMILAIKNLTSIPLTLGYGMEICQIEFSTLSQSPTRGYRERAADPHIQLDDPVFDIFEKSEKADNPLSRFLREQIDNFSK